MNKWWNSVSSCCYCGDQNLSCFMIKREEGMVCRICAKSLEDLKEELNQPPESGFKYILFAAAASLFVTLIVTAPYIIIVCLLGMVKQTLFLFILVFFLAFLEMILPYFFSNVFKKLISYGFNWFTKLSDQGLLFKGRPTGFQIVPDNLNADDGDSLEQDEPNMDSDSTKIQIKKR